MDRQKLSKCVELILIVLLYTVKFLWLVLLFLVLTFLFKSCNEALEKESQSLMGKVEVSHKK